MKISNIITRIDILKPNGYPPDSKLEWINHVDGAVWNELYKYTGFQDVLRKAGVSEYPLPENVDFSLVLKVFIEGEEIYKIDYKDFETTGFYRTPNGKLGIYPVPKSDDTEAGLRIVYKLPFIPHGSIEENAYIPSPYDKVYDNYISAMIDKYNQEMEKYQNSMAFYNSSFNEYADWYRKEE